MAHGIGPSRRTTLGDRREGLEHVSGPLGRVMADLAEKVAGRPELGSAADYDLAPVVRDALMGAVGLPVDLRRLVLTGLANDIGRDALIEAFAQFIGLANSVVENNREMIEIILICEGGMHDRQAEKANLPTVFGALNGLKVAEGIDPEKTCPGCAFRVGTPANQSSATTCDADWCGHPGESDFLCHAEGLDEQGNPTQACAGWAQLRVARKRRAA